MVNPDITHAQHMAQTMLGKSLSEWMGDEKAARYIEARPDKRKLVTLDPTQLGDYLKNAEGYLAAHNQDRDRIHYTAIDPNSFSVRDALANFWSTEYRFDLLGTMDLLQQAREEESRKFQFALEDIDRMREETRATKVTRILDLLYALDDLASKGTRPGVEVMYEGIKALQEVATRTRREAAQSLKDSQTGEELEYSISAARTTAIIFGIRFHGPDDAGNPDYIPQELRQKIYDTRSDNPSGEEQKRLWKEVQGLVAKYARLSAADYGNTSAHKQSVAEEMRITVEFLEPVLKEARLIAGALGISTGRGGGPRR